MDTKSQHLLFDAVLERDLENADIEHIKKVIENNLTVVKKIEHKFSPQGETIVFILSESHFTIHTYPENRFISMDIYVCNLETNLNKIVDEISAKIPFAEVDKKILERGHIGVEKESKNLRLVYALTVLVAGCSILYEFLLAQAISTTMGNTSLRYSLTIGLYIASMGFGALFYQKLISKHIFKEFVKIELILSLVGGVAPVMVLVFDYLANMAAKSSGISFFSPLIQMPLFTLNHLLIIAIGFLSGLELPLLIDMGKKFNKKKGNNVLAYDYLGTLLGAVLFPIVILPSLHLFTIGYVVSLVNIIVALVVMTALKIESAKYKIITWGMFILWILLIANSSAVNESITEIFYFGGKQ
jgi:S-adenosylmethionine/arginine decarboxylase-like enzyme